MCIIIFQHQFEIQIVSFPFPRFPPFPFFPIFRDYCFAFPLFGETINVICIVGGLPKCFRDTTFFPRVDLPQSNPPLIAVIQLSTYTYLCF